ncbi:hypothetical protein FOA43_000444 [Brettanomyces nanus]|uniref:chitin synthase n=1 Tax=Eeniella nana TaxID=13502 RepID=A0A875RX31_EENNA|nr:uncharacterized protein FOA43_000444 [Brettanomyces nanus]QPG73138.1 hypothetical protein FOA43_000444 [Brettanomyces nanus]
MPHEIDLNGNPRNPWHNIIEELGDPEEQANQRNRQHLQPPRPYIGDNTYIAADQRGHELIGFPEEVSQKATQAANHVTFRMPTKIYSPERYSVSSRNSNSISPTRKYDSQYSPSPTRPLLRSDVLGSGFKPAGISQGRTRIPDIPDMDGDTATETTCSSSTKIPEPRQANEPSAGHIASPQNSDPFCGYDFDDGNSEKNGDDDEVRRHGTSDHSWQKEGPEEFVPFPDLENSYYPINPPQDFYDPFSFESYYNDDGSAMESSSDDPTVKEKGEDDDDMDQFMDLYENGEGQSDLAARQVRMVNGNLVLDCPVSDVLLNKYKVPLTERDREFLFMRFQACTADPNEFLEKNFSLRQRFYTQPRGTEMLVVITMYNESEILLARTLKAVFKNIRYLYSLKHSSTWGRDAWQKIVVCVVSDGRRKINLKSKALLAAMGVYQEGFAKNKINEDKVVSHIYEYTTMVGISKIYRDHVTLTTENQVPVQMIFCLKEKNQQKINSHAWAFQAFAKILQPNIVTLVDVGTEPQTKSLYRLWKSFKDPRVAGACGEIKASLGAHDKLLLNPLVAAQNFEYKTSNILDKPMESVFGFVTVLPGAFSAYRYQALLGAPLDKYFKGQDLKKSNDDGIFNANMYLAEDRILCFELVAKKNCSWILKYVNSASAYTDVPEHLHELISQRRRWLNGSFFSAIYSLCHFYRTWHTSHSLGRKILLHIEFSYQLLNLLVSWFSLGSYYLVFRTLTVYLGDSDSNFAPGNVLSVIFLWIYLASLATTFVLALGNKPKGTKKFYLAIVWFFAILMIYMIFAAIYMGIQAIQDILQEHSSDFKIKYLFTETRFRDLIVATSSTYLLYLVGFTMYLQPWHMFNSFIQYLLLSPSYTNVFNVYAFCNMHDISWGTRGEDNANDLGVAKTTKNATDGELEIVIPTTKHQIDMAYRKIVEELTTRDESPAEETLSMDEKTSFYYANMRSITLLVWLFTNFVLVAVVTDTGGLSQLSSDSSDDDPLPMNKTFIFLTVILWIVAFMALFRFVGSSTYLILKLVDRFRLRKFRKSYSIRGAQYDV